MKRKVILIALVLVLASFAGCTEKKLTTNRAQKAVNKWHGSQSGSITVLGVHELSQENTATADLEFADLPVQDMLFGKPDKFSGKGKASFKKYSDGRWVLTEVYAGYGIGRWWKDLSIAAN